ncbi:SDR family NAD(P)-dependent oxidoreductase [Runella sp.]|jgi:nucleoside-diphosphate-sugar epimerase|uniref:SDR family NAD(P)-dependent oxidoreductase n=1 Tax=Runella sp. TaxID=1960881 RepID=UPI00262F38D8|nr:SDR family NAD(P)-dependent oxidoreductase [Runella sp.]
MAKIIVVAGATGNLGERICKALLDQGAEVRALVRSNSDRAKVNHLQKSGIKVVQVDMQNGADVAAACQGASCVVSALAGLREVIVDTQKILLDAAIKAGVPRFIPSDYSLDFTKFSDGENRNLDLRREFHTYLDTKPITATTIFNGAFTDLLTHEMPLILFKQKRVLYWGKADHPLWFTTIDNTAEYTANVALDPTTPRFLRIAGDQVSPREIKEAVSKITGEHFRFFWAGGPGLLSFLIKVARLLAPSPKELYPAWQGMQYMRNMIDKRADLTATDNHRYPSVCWTGVKEFLADYQAGKQITLENTLPLSAE